jgi:hypothetical protein
MRHAQKDQSTRSRTLKEHVFVGLANSTSQRRFLIRVSTGRAKAELAFEVACRNVIERARVSNTKIVICRDGIVVKLTPDEAEQELEVNLAKRQDKLPES